MQVSLGHVTACEDEVQLVLIEGGLLEVLVTARFGYSLRQVVAGCNAEVPTKHRLCLR